MTGSRISDMTTAVSLRGDVASYIPIVVDDPALSGNAKNQKLDARNLPGLSVGLFSEISTTSVPAGTTLLFSSGYSYEGIGPAYYIENSSLNDADVAADPRWRVKTANGRYFEILRDYLHPEMFGAIDQRRTEGGIAFDSLAALVAFNKCVFDHSVTTGVPPRLVNFGGQYGISAHLDIGFATEPASSTWITMVGDLRLRPTSTGATPSFEFVRIRHLLRQNVQGWGVYALGYYSGQNPAPFANRLWGMGIVLQNCGRGLLGRLRAAGFWRTGIGFSVANNNFCHVSSLEASDCGSGHGTAANGKSLTTAWSNPVDNGASSSNSQYTEIDLVTLPDEAGITFYTTINNQQLYLRIPAETGELYHVGALDWATKKVQVFPWLNPDAGSSGTAEWCFGAAVEIRTNDSNQVGWDELTAQDCGAMLRVSSLYGPVGQKSNATGCGTVVAIGNGPSNACIGTLLSSVYIEGGSSNREHIVVNNRFSGSNYHIINGEVALDLAKCYARGEARLTGGSLPTQSFGQDGTGHLTLTKFGILLNRERSASLTGGSTRTFNEQQYQYRVLTQYVDAQTVTLSIRGTGEYLRLFGYRGARYCYVGTGTGGKPTGTITFNAPTTTATGTTTNLSDVVSAMSSTSSLAAGMPVSGSGIPGGTTIVSVDSSTEITLSANATATASGVTLTFTGSVNGAFANAAFSGFNGPVDFEIFFTAESQMAWQVRPLSGWSKEGVIGITTVGDASTVLTRTSERTQWHNTAITADRTVTLPAPGQEGSKFRIIRGPSATGAFNLTVQTSAPVTVKVLNVADMWCDVEDDGTEYRLTAAGTL